MYYITLLQDDSLSQFSSKQKEPKNELRKFKIMVDDNHKVKISKCW